MERVITRSAGIRKAAGARPLVLAVEPLARRNGPVDAARTAAYLGGSRWLARVWKRVALRTPAVSRAARCAMDAALNLPRKIYARANLVISRACVFRSVSMSFKF